MKAGRGLTTAGAGLIAEKRQEERKVAWIFKPGFALLIGSPGINIKLIQYVDLEIALIQQHWGVARALLQKIDSVVTGYEPKGRCTGCIRWRRRRQCTSSRLTANWRPETRGRFHLTHCPIFGVHF